MLAFSPHPDDAELHVSGILLKHGKNYKTGIIELTRGELSTNGNPQQRAKEAAKAATHLKLSLRENLGISDGKIDSRKEEQHRLIIEKICTLRPAIVLLPYWEDDHPDHREASLLITDCLFKSSLEKFAPGYAPHRVFQYFYYSANPRVKPNLIVDVSLEYEQKLQALTSYVSQFGESEKVTYLNHNRIVHQVRLRDQYHGSLIGSEYGEGLIYQGILAVDNLFVSGII